MNMEFLLYLCCTDDIKRIINEPKVTQNAYRASYPHEKPLITCLPHAHVTVVHIWFTSDSQELAAMFADPKAKEELVTNNIVDEPNHSGAPCALVCQCPMNAPYAECHNQSHRGRGHALDDGIILEPPQGGQGHL